MLDQPLYKKKIKRVKTKAQRKIKENQIVEKMKTYKEYNHLIIPLQDSISCYQKFITVGWRKKQKN
jgi:hypothetical protein